jgi:hypothetical protein
VTHDHGASFNWTPLTENSTHDNLRPIVPVAGPDYHIVLWFRTNYRSAQLYDAAPVGLVERREQTPGPKTFVKATTSNTKFANGTALAIGNESGQWHLRSSNLPADRSKLFASADVTAEDAPALRTTVRVSHSGTYHLWVTFWCSTATNADWRIVAGLATNQMQVYRRAGCQSVQPTSRDSGRILQTDGTNFLYQAYLGRATPSSKGTLEIFVDDQATKTGTTQPLVGDTVRTWYEGIAYSRLSAR